MGLSSRSRVIFSLYHYEALLSDEDRLDTRDLGNQSITRRVTGVWMVLGTGLYNIRC